MRYYLILKLWLWWTFIINRRVPTRDALESMIYSNTNCEDTYPVQMWTVKRLYKKQMFIIILLSNGHNVTDIPTDLIEKAGI